MYNFLKFTLNSLVLLIPYLLIYSQAMLCDDTITLYCVYANVFCFNGFNQAAIVIRYSAHIKPRKTIKTIKPDNITHKHNMTLIVSSLSIAVNK